jgi:low affinity Fe/Cu permease
MKKKFAGPFEQLAQWFTRWTGSTWATVIAFAFVLLWTAFGPFYHFSTDYQMIINTGTSVVTFLMVFLIQRSQNKDSAAIQLKLNEVVAALEGASNRLIGIEELSEADIQVLRQHYKHLAELAKKEAALTESHSVEEAMGRHKAKQRRGRAPGAETAPGAATGQARNGSDG